MGSDAERDYGVYIDENGVHIYAERIEGGELIKSLAKGIFVDGSLVYVDKIVPVDIISDEKDQKNTDFNAEEFYKLLEQPFDRE